ncbi:hypothetical protein LGQ02_04580 [Bacillus shivajii]|uniref:hypothetical protein n=1 Tax=Bacillus shivajii TaxID=1983719 RepID=UPI001CFA6B30|nr:hypothetical protein [Bacillus shivajii]UCZ54064.1 hypothetical protein LGQ02_04580 [Bacillus shivajii]
MAIILFILAAFIDFTAGGYMGFLLLVVALIINHKRLGKYTYMLGHPDRRHDGYPSEGKSMMNESYTLDKKEDEKNPKDKTHNL